MYPKNVVSRITLAFRSFFAILTTGKLPESVVTALNLQKKTPPAPPAPKATPADGAMQILGLLQREGRLVDFFMEDIAGYADDQVGAAVRPIHESSRKTLARVCKLTPVIDGVEGTYTKLISMDTSAVRVLGKVAANQTVEGGTLRHRGWRADKVNLPPIARGEDVSVLAPAEIEVE